MLVAGRVLVVVVMLNLCGDGGYGFRIVHSTNYISVNSKTECIHHSYSSQWRGHTSVQAFELKVKLNKALDALHLKV